ncbi:MAG TPA: hypothetical protein VIY52_15360 [Streptosporangiaceae bacterium]
MLVGAAPWRSCCWAGRVARSRRDHHRRDHGRGGDLPQYAWQQPILRLAETVVGVAVGAAAAWAGLRVRRFRSARSVPPAAAGVKAGLS